MAWGISKPPKWIIACLGGNFTKGINDAVERYSEKNSLKVTPEIAFHVFEPTVLKDFVVFHGNSSGELSESVREQAEETLWNPIRDLLRTRFDADNILFIINKSSMTNAIRSGNDKVVMAEVRDMVCGILEEGNHFQSKVNYFCKLYPSNINYDDICKLIFKQK